MIGQGGHGIIIITGPTYPGIECSWSQAIYRAGHIETAVLVGNNDHVGLGPDIESCIQVAIGLGDQILVGCEHLVARDMPPIAGYAVERLRQGFVFGVSQMFEYDCHFAVDARQLIHT